MAKVLLVDDEATLLQLLRRYLERQGHQVETADSPASAVRTAAAHTFDVIVSDYTLPGTNGEQLIEQIRATQPGIAAIIASGYPHEPKLANVGFLLKPFLPQMLADAIAAALEKRSE